MCTAVRVLLFGSALLLSACGGDGGDAPSETGSSPVFTSTNSINVDENTTSTGYTATASDADGDTVTFSLSVSADQALFSIDSSSGVLSFNTAPNFEAPTDSDSNNIYVTEITASDGTHMVSLTVTVTVTNVNEAPPGCIWDSSNWDNCIWGV